MDKSIKTLVILNIIVSLITLFILWGHVQVEVEPNTSDAYKSQGTIF